MLPGSGIRRALLAEEVLRGFINVVVVAKGGDD